LDLIFDQWHDVVAETELGSLSGAMAIKPHSTHEQRSVSIRGPGAESVPRRVASVAVPLVRTLDVYVSFSGSNHFGVVFLAILPFKDGNGRLDNYYLALRRTQQTIGKGKRSWEYWLVFFLRRMVQAEEQPAAKVHEEQALRSSLPAFSRQILEFAKTEPGRLMAPRLPAPSRQGLIDAFVHATPFTDPAICSILRPNIRPNKYAGRVFQTVLPSESVRVYV
jgi:hypothetical protein